MALEAHMPGIAGVIQLAIAPVFLLTGVGAFLNVLTSRLSRVVDRSRMLDSMSGAANAQVAQHINVEQRVLSVRARWVNRSISACTACALLVCLEIVSLFVGAFFDTDVSMIAGILFICSILALVLGLGAFLREIFLAINHLVIGGHRPGF